MADPNLRDYEVLIQIRGDIQKLKRLIWQGKFNHLMRFLNYLFDFLSLSLIDSTRRKAMQDKYDKEEDAYAKQEGTYKNTLNIAEQMMARMEQLEKTVAGLTQENRYQKSEIKELKADNERLREKYRVIQKENSVLKIISSKGDSGSESEKSGSISLKINGECKFKAELKFNEDQTLTSPRYNAYGGFWDTVLYDYHCRTTGRNEELLKSAAAKGNVEQVRLIIDARETNINGRGLPDSLCAIFSGGRDKTPLMLASENGKLETVRLLLRNDANVFLTDRSGRSAMDYAVKNNYPRIAMLLKHRGAQGQEVSPPISPPMSPTVERKESMESFPVPSFTNGAW